MQKRKGKYVVKVVPVTTNNVTTAIVNFLLSEGHSASRVNVQGQWDNDKKLFRPSGSRKGFSDIAAVLAPTGRSLNVEVKFSLSDTQGDDQIEFEQEVTAAGGLYIIAKRYDDFLGWYNEAKGKYF